MNDATGHHDIPPKNAAPISAEIDHSAANPFSTRCVRPGIIAYQFPAGVDAAILLERLRAGGWRGQIVGPHGSGKSTLLATLLPLLSDAGRDPLLVTLHDGERSLAAHRATLAKAGPRTIVIVDGYEQLAPWNQWRLRWGCRRRGQGLIVTAHKTVGLPLLAETAVDAATAVRVFETLVPSPTLVTRDDLQSALAAHPGNLRETLFDLYDLYEMRRPRKE
jgi:hypothetical protein